MKKTQWSIIFMKKVLKQYVVVEAGTKAEAIKKFRQGWGALRIVSIEPMSTIMRRIEDAMNKIDKDNEE